MWNHSIYSITCVLDSNSNVKLTKLDINPNPITIPGKVTFHAAGETTRDLSSVSMTVKAVRKSFLFDVTIPCVKNIGSWCVVISGEALGSHWAYASISRLHSVFTTFSSTSSQLWWGCRVRCAFFHRLQFSMKHYEQGRISTLPHNENYPAIPLNYPAIPLYAAYWRVD